jgi:hypothetical protein
MMRPEPKKVPLPPEAEVPCSNCGATCIEEYIEETYDHTGWVLGRKKIRACYSCGNVEDA